MMPETQSNLMPDTQSAMMPETQSDLMPDTQSAMMTDMQSDLMPDTQSDMMLDTHSDMMPDTQSDVTQLTCEDAASLTTLQEEQGQPVVRQTTTNVTYGMLKRVACELVEVAMKQSNEAKCGVAICGMMLRSTNLLKGNELLRGAGLEEAVEQQYLQSFLAHNPNLFSKSTVLLSAVK